MIFSFLGESHQEKKIGQSQEILSCQNFTVLLLKKNTTKYLQHRI